MRRRVVTMVLRAAGAVVRDFLIVGVRFRGVGAMKLLLDEVGRAVVARVGVRDHQESEAGSLAIRRNADMHGADAEMGLHGLNRPRLVHVDQQRAADGVLDAQQDALVFLPDHERRVDVVQRVHQHVIDDFAVGGEGVELGRVDVGLGATHQFGQVGDVAGDDEFLHGCFNLLKSTSRLTAIWIAMKQQHYSL